MKSVVTLLLPFQESQITQKEKNAITRKSQNNKMMICERIFTTLHHKELICEKFFKFEIKDKIPIEKIKAEAVFRKKAHLLVNM